MSANIFFLYAATVLIWGTTWLGIKLQLGSVDPMVSVLYRFIAAALILMVYCRLADLRMRFHLKDHIFMALQGLVLFSVNYWIIYMASVHLTSGLVAVIFWLGGLVEKPAHRRVDGLVAPSVAADPAASGI